MTLKIRRVVTGHDAQGRARVAIDELCGNVISRRPSHASCVVWSTGEFPADNGDERDGAAREVATTDPNGTVFRIVEYRAGVAPRNHRTESIDYAVVLAGEIDMELEGETVRLRAGDVLHAAAGASTTRTLGAWPWIDGDPTGTAGASPIRIVAGPAPGADVVAIVTAHPELDYGEVVAAAPLVVDFRGVTRGIEAKNLVRL